MTIIMVFATGALAAFVQTNVDPARFFVVDTGGDSSVTLSILQLLGSGTLRYSTDKTTWTVAVSGSSVPFSVPIPNGKRLVYWKLDSDTDADLTFDGPKTDGYGVVAMLWSTGSYKISLITPQYCDAVAPVPIGSSALLLGSSIFGLMGFGIWRKHKILGSE